MISGVECGSPRYPELPEDIYGGERIPQQQLSYSRVKAARKRHRCCDCLSWIEPGHSYIREFWLVDGEPTSIARHGGCSYY